MIIFTHYAKHECLTFCVHLKRPINIFCLSQKAAIFILSLKREFLTLRLDNLSRFERHLSKAKPCLDLTCAYFFTFPNCFIAILWRHVLLGNCVSFAGSFIAIALTGPKEEKRLYPYIDIDQLKAKII